MAHWLDANPAAESVNREHLVVVVVLQDGSDGQDGLLVLVQCAVGLDVVEALRVRRHSVT